MIGITFLPFPHALLGTASSVDNDDSLVLA
jgi:hypothetical protein